jgi:ATP phosphoribosyltransferase regulatory subunit
MQKSPFPLRLSYKGRVFRNVNLNKGIKSEKYQMGAELFGANEYFGDIESILIAFRVAEKIGINDFKIVIGDIRLLNLLMSKINNSQKYKNLLTGKQFSNLKKVITDMEIDENLKKILIFLPYAFGDIKILEELFKKSLFDKEIKDRIEYIKNTFIKLISLGVDEDKLIFDAGETRGMDYYTGLNFDIIHTERGVSLGGGGRYDSLTEKFELKNISACGVAFNIEEILRFYNPDKLTKDFDYLIIGEENLPKAEKLRQEGNSVFWIQDKIDEVKVKTWYKFKN